MSALVRLSAVAKSVGGIRIAGTSPEKEAEKKLLPVAAKTLEGLKRRFKSEGVSEVRLLQEMPTKRSADDEYFYTMAIYGLMTNKNPSGRCGVLTFILRYFPEDDIADVSVRMKLGSDPTVTVESGSPVGVITRVLNYLTKIERDGKGFEHWASTYVRSGDAKKDPKKVIR